MIRQVVLVGMTTLSFGQLQTDLLENVISCGCSTSMTLTRPSHEVHCSLLEKAIDRMRMVLPDLEDVFSACVRVCVERNIWYKVLPMASNTARSIAHDTPPARDAAPGLSLDFPFNCKIFYGERCCHCEGNEQVDMFEYRVPKCQQFGDYHL